MFMAIHALDTLGPLSDFHLCLLVTQHDLSQLRSCPYMANSTFPAHCEPWPCGQRPPRRAPSQDLQSAERQRPGCRADPRDRELVLPQREPGPIPGGTVFPPSSPPGYMIASPLLRNHGHTGHDSQFGLPGTDGVTVHERLPRRPASLFRVSASFRTVNSTVPFTATPAFTTCHF